jgi:Toprim domain
VKLDYETLHDLRDGRFGSIDTPCPSCGPLRNSPLNRRRKTLRLWCADPNFISFHCARCGDRGWANNSGIDRSTTPIGETSAIRAEIERRDLEEAHDRLKVALALWRRRIPVCNTAVEIYLRDARGYGGSIPATIGFLPASGDYAPAMISAFGMARETLPGDIVIDDQAVRGVHITSIKPDGSGKAGTDRDKVMIGRSSGFPIVLAPPNDLLGLAVTEGIEDVSVLQATGLGVWAAGSASRLPALADRIPRYVECVTIVADDDDVGRMNAEQLAAAIPRENCEVRIMLPPRTGAP